MKVCEICHNKINKFTDHEHAAHVVHAYHKPRNIRDASFNGYSLYCQADDEEWPCKSHLEYEKEHE